MRSAKKRTPYKTRSVRKPIAAAEPIVERERNRLAHLANERFIRSGIEVRDVYGKLSE